MNTSPEYLSKIEYRVQDSCKSCHFFKCFPDTNDVEYCRLHDNGVDISGVCKDYNKPYKLNIKVIL